MIIGGIRKLSTLDFPGLLCVTVFTKGCNFRCPFCHNSSLVLTGNTDKVETEEIFSLLQKRKGVIDGLCLTGGEPLINDVEEIEDFFSRVKALGYKTKLDTNGYFPKKLSYLMEKGLLDYVAMDIKNSPGKYSCTTDTEVDFSKIKESASVLMNGNVDFEFRTTVVKDFHTAKDMKEIGMWLSGKEKYFLQSFVMSDNTIKQGLCAYSKDELEKLRKEVLPFIPNTFLRGV